MEMVIPLYSVCYKKEKMSEILSSCIFIAFYQINEKTFFALEEINFTG